jgi:hypothetical protein
MSSCSPRMQSIGRHLSAFFASIAPVFSGDQRLGPSARAVPSPKGLCVCGRRESLLVYPGARHGSPRPDCTRKAARPTGAGLLAAFPALSANNPEERIALSELGLYASAATLAAIAAYLLLLFATMPEPFRTSAVWVVFVILCFRYGDVADLWLAWGGLESTASEVVDPLRDDAIWARGFT